MVSQKAILDPARPFEPSYAFATRAAWGRASHTMCGDPGMSTVVTIARPVLHVLTQVVDNHAGDGNVGLLEHGLGTLQRHELMCSGTDNQHRGVDHPSQHPAIGHAQDGRTIQDHPVIVVLKGRQQLPQLECAQDLDGDVLCVARGDEVEIAQFGMVKRLLPGQCALQHIDESLGTRLLVGFYREYVSEGRTAKIDVQQQGPLAGPCAGGGKVESRRALAIAGLGARHQHGHHGAMAIGDAEQAGTDVAKGVGLKRVGSTWRPEMAAAMRQRGPPNPGNDSQQGQGQSLGHMLRNLHRVVDVLEQQDQTDAHAEAQHQSHPDIDHSVRSDRHGRLDHAGWNSDRLFLRPGQNLEVGDVTLHLGHQLAATDYAPPPASGISDGRASIPASGREPPGAGPCPPRFALLLIENHLRGCFGHLGLESTPDLRFRPGSR